MFGGTGDSFSLGSVQQLHAEAIALESILAKYKMSALARSSCTGDAAVESVLSQTRGKSLPPSKRFPKLKVAAGDTSGGRISRRFVCDGCGKLFPKLSRCACCTSSAYCQEFARRIIGLFTRKYARQSERSVNLFLKYFICRYKLYFYLINSGDFFYFEAL